MPEPSPSVPTPADLLTLGLGAGLEDVDVEVGIELGEFLCACPDLELRSCLGRGGMGIVYRARQVRLDREVAVKLMSPELGRDPELGRRFEQEAKALARLDHPGIVRVHDFGQAADVYYLVMELVDGPNLRELIEQGVSDEQAMGIVDQLCDALAYAHERGVVHRDVKPENVLVDRAGRVKVADFGLAKLQADRLAGATRTRRVLGTPQYMAPEQLRDPASVDQRCDIFAIGVVFYEMLTGQLPVGRFPAPSELGRGDAELDEIVLRALESSRERRFQAASEIRAALSSIGAGPHAVTEVDPLASGRPRWWLPAGLVAAAATGVLAWSLVDREPEAATEVAADSGEVAIAPGEVVQDAGSGPVPDAAKQLNRWPAEELLVLDPDVIGVAGVDWSELSQSPVVGELSEAALSNRPDELLRCKADVLDRTHKMVAAFTSTELRELVVHADWEPSQLRPCLDELASLRERRGGRQGPKITESTLGPYLRLVVELPGEDEPTTLTIAHRDQTVVVSLRDDVTVEQLEAKLAGEPTSEALRDQVIHRVDLSAPIWVAAEPEPGLLPMGMLSIAGGIELWNELGVDATATFADEAAATKAETLAQSYANILAAVPDFPSPPEVSVTREGLAVRVRGTMVLPDFSKARERSMKFDFGRRDRWSEEAGEAGAVIEVIEVDAGVGAR